MASEQQIVPNVDMDVDLDVDVDTNTGDHDKFAHYVAKDKLLESQVTGMPVVAFCGKIWVPKDDPSKYPVCPSCVEKKARLDRRFAN